MLKPRATLASRKIVTEIRPGTWGYMQLGIYLESDYETAINISAAITSQRGVTVLLSKAPDGYLLSTYMPKMLAGDLKKNYVCAILPDGTVVKDLNRAYRECLEFYKFTALGCVKQCQYGPDDCLNHLLPKIGYLGKALNNAVDNSIVTLQKVDRQTWQTGHVTNVSQWQVSRISEMGNQEDYADWLIGYLRELDEQKLVSYIAPSYTEVHHFPIKIKDVYDIDFTAHEGARTLYRERSIRSSKSKEFGKKHCSKCLLSCNTVMRRRCSGEITREEIKKFVEDQVTKNWGSLPAWNNKGLQAALKLQGTVFSYKGYEYGPNDSRAKRGTRSVISRIVPTDPVRPNSSNLKAHIVRDWGSDSGSSSESLDTLVEAHPELREKLKRIPDIKTNNESRTLFLYLGLTSNIYRSTGGFGSGCYTVYSVTYNIYTDSYESLVNPTVVRRYYPGGSWRSLGVSDYEDLHNPYQGSNLFDDLRTNPGRANW